MNIIKFESLTKGMVDFIYNVDKEIVDYINVNENTNTNQSEKSIKLQSHSTDTLIRKVSS